MKTKNINTLLTSIFFTIFFFGLMSTTVVHAQVGNYSLVTTWSLSPDSGHTPYPKCISVDSSDNIYVADYGTNLIEKFTSNGTLVTKWTFEDFATAILCQRGIVVDSSKNVYVIEATNPNIKKFTVNSMNNYSLATTWNLGPDSGHKPYPTCIAVDSSDNVYVADYGTNLIEKFASNGTLVTKWTFENTTYGKVGQHGIAVDSSGNVYVIEATNPIIRKFTVNSMNNYSLATTWSLSPDSGHNPYPTCIAVDSSDYVYVGDYGTNLIEKFTSEGTLVTKWTFENTTSGRVGQNGIVVDSSGNVYIIEAMNPNIRKFTPSISLEANFSTDETIGFAPLFIHFTDTSIGSPTSWLWNFGDGNTSTEQNPIYTYNKYGNYTVTLTVSNSEGTDTASQIITVKNLDFKVNPSKIRISDKVEFNASQSVNSMQNSIVWDFGDGKKDSSGNPVVYHNYSEPKQYTVKLTVTDSMGKVATKSQLVNVTIPVVLVHGFSSSSETWVDMSSALQKNGFEVWNFDYGIYSTKNPQDIAPKLSDFIEGKRNDLTYNGQKYNGKIDIVCHSMGAIVSRLYMEQYQGGIHGKEVRQWIGIAPAHGGSAGADCYSPVEQEKSTTFLKFIQAIPPQWYALYQKIGPAVNELKTNSASVQTLATGSLSSTTKYRILVGWNPTHSLRFGRYVLSATLAKNTSRPDPYYWTYSGDMIVATVQSYDERIKNFEAFPIDGKLGSSPAEEFDHLHITKSPTVIQYVIDCLKDINKPSSNKLPPDDEVKSYNLMQVIIYGILNSEEQHVNIPVSKPVSTVSKALSNSYVEINSLTDEQGISSSQGNVLSVLLEWDEGNIAVDLISPSGVEYSANSHPDSVWYIKEGNLLYYIVPDPECGNWTVNLVPEEYPSHGIHYNLTYWTGNLNNDESKIPPVANFTTNVTTGYAPLTVQFTDLSKNATLWKWDFGDVTYSTEQNPVHTYTKEGNYTVLLNSSNSAGYDIEQKIIHVVNDSAPEIALIGNKSVSVNELLSFNVSATDADGDAILYSATGLPIGAIFDAITGSFSWIPGTGTAGTYDITFNATANGITDSESIRITVLSNEGHEDQPPVLALIGDKSVSVNELLNFPISAIDADGDSIAYSSVDLPSGATLDAITGVFNWKPDTAGTYYVTFNATANGKSYSETIKITVSQLVTEDHAPELTLIGNKSISVNSLLILSVSATDSDGDIISYLATGLPTGAVFDPTTATFSWTPSIIDVGTYYVTFSAAANGKTDSEIIKITVLSNEGHEDQPPVLAAIGAKSVNIKSLLCFTISANDPDGDIVKCSATGLPCGAKLDATTGKFTWTPTTTGTYTVKFIATANGQSDYETVKITVKNTNKPPVLACIGSKTIEKGKQLSVTISARDPDGDKVKYSATGLPKGAKLDATSGKFTWTPTTTGTYTVKFIATANGQSDYETMKITVKNANKPPVLAVIGSKTVKEGKQLCVTISAKDPDGDKVKYSATGLPKGAKFDATTGKFTWTPGYSAAGTYSVKFTATANGQSDSETVKITVKNVK